MSKKQIKTEVKLTQNQLITGRIYVDHYAKQEYGSAICTNTYTVFVLGL